MYSKVKYLIYASFFLFFVLMFAAIQNKVSLVAEQKAQEQIQKEFLDKSEKYRKIEEERNKNKDRQQENSNSRNNYTSDEIRDSFQPVIQDSSSERQMSKETESNSVQNVSADKITESQSSYGKLYFVSDKTEAQDYFLCKKFIFSGNDYAIIAVNDNRYVSEYSKYITRKYYIYKKNDTVYARIHYLFDKSEEKTDTVFSDISVEINNYDVKITYNSKPPLKRTVSQSVLLNNAYQYANEPLLTDSAENTAQSEGTDLTEN